MDVFGGPSALGGIMMCVALVAWIMGRWQGSAMPGHESGGDRWAAAPRLLPELSGPVMPDRQAAPDECRSVPDVMASLGELHEEVSAYRRAEQVLAGLDQGELELLPAAADQRSSRGYGVTGQPPEAAPFLVQPSPSSDFMRV